MPGAPERLYPVAPSVALAELCRPLEDRMAELARQVEGLRGVLEPVEAVYAEARLEQQLAPTTLVDAAEINAALHIAVSACERDLINVQPDGGRPESALAESAERVLPKLRQGVRNRSLYQHVVRTHPPTMRFVEQVIEAGGEVRTLSDLTERMIVCDRTVAFIPVSAGRRDEMLAIRNAGMIDLLIGVFERAWLRAVPVVPSPARATGPDVVSDLHMSIMRLLVTGSTDSAIAHRLGFSSRTVTEHVRRISGRLNSNSRAQLGYLIATSGLLDEPISET
ncbi:LuxR C-terminal-related transcriptional regulator [Streptomyces sp. NPDC048242]|uniref:LuxR C-terminal-related transcriptional regulator n=1 Tax=Streptomyces sp. NPDC048242 TaxID=3155026 RepID=UPI0034409EC3